MKSRNVFILILVFVTLLTVHLFVSFFSRNRSGNSTKNNNIPFDPKVEKPPQKTEKTPGSGSFPSPVVVVPIESPEVLDNMDKAIKERDKEIAKKNLIWVNEQINDLSLASKTREIYRLRLIPEVGKAHEALRNGDRAAAMEFFEKAFNDPKASIVTKYLCLDYMIDIARKNKDPELFFALWKKQGEMVKTEDLSTLKVDKGPKLLEVIERKERYYRASKDPAAMAAIIDKVSKGRAEVATRWRERILKEAKEVQENFDEK